MTRSSRRGLSLLAVVAAVAVVALAGVGTTLALWKDTDSRPGAVLTNGNLDLVDQAAITWVETTPGVASPRSGTGLTGSTGVTSFAGAPGDTIEVRYRVRSLLVGDNISAVMRASLNGPAPAGVTVDGYRILSTTGTQLAPASGYQALGSTTPVGALTVASDTELLVAVKVTYTGALTYTADVTGSTPTTPVTFGLRFALEQVRTGTGFTS